MVIEPKLQIRSNSIISYNRFTGDRSRSALQIESGDKLKDRKTYTGKITPGAKKRLTKAIELMVQNTQRTFVKNPYSGKLFPFQIGFTTLTIHSPGRNIDQKEAYKTLLAPFLKWLKETKGCNLYLWKAELQGRGQLHYHLLIGKFIYFKEIQKKWNDLQARGGYLDDYFNKQGHYNAPSTHIKDPLNQKQDITGYLIKEICKTMQNNKTVGGKVWDCSMILKEMSYFEVDGNKYGGAINQLIRDSKLQATYTDSCAIYKAQQYDTTGFLDKLDTYLFSEHIEALREAYLKPKEKKPDKLADLPKRIVNIAIQTNLFSSS